MIKKLDKYSYGKYEQINDHGPRTYDVDGNRLPSVTTVLGATKDKSFLYKWQARVGKEEAERIKTTSASRGTSMHKYLENYVLGKGYEDMTEMGQLSKTMAQKVIDIGLAPVDGYFGSEVTLYYPGLYAGSTDLVGLHNGQESIIDFKQSNRPKRIDWIEDYFMQIAAYAMAHDCVHGSKIQQGVIMICTPDLYYQEFKIEGLQLRKWKHEFLKRLDQYFKLKNNSKEQGNVNTSELLKEFEKDGNEA
jgi:genome maintenance exonuclease 1